MSSEGKSLERGWRAMVSISVYNHTCTRLRTLRYILQNSKFSHLIILTTSSKMFVLIFLAYNPFNNNILPDSNL